jgi:hypothetical protein
MYSGLLLMWPVLLLIALVLLGATGGINDAVAALIGR